MPNNTWVHISDDPAYGNGPWTAPIDVNLLQYPDPVQGNNAIPGDIGISNIPLAQLWWNQQYLMNRGGAFSDIVVYDSSQTMPDTDLGKMVMLSVDVAGVVGELTLPSLSRSAPYHLVITNINIRPWRIYKASADVLVNGHRFINSGATPLDYVVLMPGESMTLVPLYQSTPLTKWVVISKDAAMDQTGQIVAQLGDVGVNGLLQLKGQTVLREDYPRLWAYLNSNIAVNTLIVDESAWTSNTGRYSKGNGTTTFRLPDWRGRYIRSLNDSNTGIDPNQVQGALEDDLLGTHNHVYYTRIPFAGAGGNSGFGYGVIDIANTTQMGGLNPNPALQQPSYTEDSGGVETRPKSVLLYHYVRV